MTSYKVIAMDVEKTVSDFITLSNDDDGISYALEKFIF